MRLCFLVDARSPISRSWIDHFLTGGDEVHIISSFPSQQSVTDDRVASKRSVPLGLTSWHRATTGRSSEPGRSLGPFARLARLRYGRFGQLADDVRCWVAAAAVHHQAEAIGEMIEAIDPDLVHAMRLPFEGIAGALSEPTAPLLISIWGNDFTLYAERYRAIGHLTRTAMKVASGLHTDCARDMRLAERWGFSPSKPNIVLPGAGGVDDSIFHPGPVADHVAAQLGIDPGQVVVLNPRGLRRYVRNDTFFRAIPLILEKHPNAVFLCSAMKGQPAAEQWIDRLDIRNSVRLLPHLPPAQMADIYRMASITVSPSVHDGTPNSLLEAMASGCLPVAGNIESVREWIIDGINGLLCESDSPRSVADAVGRAITDDELGQTARHYNAELIAQRGSFVPSMKRAREFYAEIIHSS